MNRLYIRYNEETSDEYELSSLDYNMMFVGQQIVHLHTTFERRGYLYMKDIYDKFGLVISGLIESVPSLAEKIFRYGEDELLLDYQAAKYDDTDVILVSWYKKCKGPANDNEYHYEDRGDGEVIALDEYGWEKNRFTNHIHQISAEFDDIRTALLDLQISFLELMEAMNENNIHIPSN